jgi:hypothetical protein
VDGQRLEAGWRRQPADPARLGAGSQAFTILNDEERGPASVRAAVGALALAADVTGEQPYVEALVRPLGGRVQRRLRVDSPANRRVIMLNERLIHVLYAGLACLARLGVVSSVARRVRLSIMAMRIMVVEVSRRVSQSRARRGGIA